MDIEFFIANNISFTISEQNKKELIDISIRIIATRFMNLDIDDLLPHMADQSG
jgi:hypothetical protein